MQAITNICMSTIIHTARSKLHLNILEALHIMHDRPVLCRQKQFVYYTLLFKSSGWYYKFFPACCSVLMVCSPFLSFFCDVCSVLPTCFMITCFYKTRKMPFYLPFARRTLKSGNNKLRSAFSFVFFSMLCLSDSSFYLALNFLIRFLSYSCRM